MTKEYDYTCANCNGLVARPNTIYGWGGSFCNCKEPKKLEPVKTTTFMTKEQTNNWELAKRFHDLYEKYAPDFGYATREDTKEFDPETPNGRLMTKVCNEVISQEKEKCIKEEVFAFMHHLQEKANTLPPNLLLNEVVNYAYDRVNLLQK